MSTICKVYVMRISGPFIALAMVAAGASAGHAQSRYTPPPAVVLSQDLASPWILQLSNKPARPGQYTVRVAPPVMPSTRRNTVSAYTPLQADPVRRANPQAQAVSMQRPAADPAGNPKKRTQEFDPELEMQIVDYPSEARPGSIIVDTGARRLYLIEGDGKARRYGIGVGREGFEWSGSHNITRKAEWPSWTPPQEMIAREAARGKFLPARMEGGPENPLGARALYIGDTLYRIHGTNQPWTIGKAVSSGCIRMRNEDVIDLFERVKVGAKVTVI